MNLCWTDFNAFCARVQQFEVGDRNHTSRAYRSYDGAVFFGRMQITALENAFFCTQKRILNEFQAGPGFFEFLQLNHFTFNESENKR